MDVVCTSNVLMSGKHQVAVDTSKALDAIKAVTSKLSSEASRFRIGFRAEAAIGIAKLLY